MPTPKTNVESSDCTWSWVITFPFSATRHSLSNTLSGGGKSSSFSKCLHLAIASPWNLLRTARQVFWRRPSADNFQTRLLRFHGEYMRLVIKAHSLPNVQWINLQEIFYQKLLTSQSPHTLPHFVGATRSKAPRARFLCEETRKQ